MSPTNQKALNTTRLRLAKHNKDYEEEMAAYRENPESSEPEDIDGTSSSDGDDGESGGEDWKDSQPTKKKDKLASMDKEDITYEMVAEKLKEILQSRGKRGTDRQEQVEMMTFLVSVAKGPAQKLQVLAHLVSSLFDLNPSMASHMKVSQWKTCTQYMLELLSILMDNPGIKLEEDAELVPERTKGPEPGEEVKVWCSLVAFVERLDDELFKSLQVIDPHTHEYLDRLKDEPYFLALAQRALGYLTRTQDFKGLPRVALRLVEHYYYKADNVYDAMRRLTIQKQEEDVHQGAGGEDDEAEDDDDTETKPLKVPADFVMEENAHRALQNLVSIIFKHGDERAKARAMLCSIFHKCIHDDFYTARDWMLMSHLQDNVHLMDISTQILYNRTISQMGLCAFRAGLIPEAHSCVGELYSSGHVKELLAQGMTMSRYQEKTPEQEKLERRRQMPFHMHINLELLESVHLISAMLLEVPNLAANPLDAPRRMSSKPFISWLLNSYQSHTYLGPPENVKDHVVAATRALLTGDWRKAYEYVSVLPCWNLIPQKDNVLAMLKGKLQEEGLRTFLFAYSSQYRSLSLDQLCGMFELPPQKVRPITSRMIINDEIHGAWDQPTSTVVMHNIEATKLQSASMQFADKVSLLLEMNERALRAIRTGNIHEADDDGGHGGRRRGGWDEHGGGGRQRSKARLGGAIRSAGMAQRGWGKGYGSQRGPFDRGYQGGYRQQQQQSSMSSLGSLRNRQNQRRAPAI